MSNTKELDLIIWGATGFTGQLVSEYINKKYSNSTLKWGIAGRNKEKASVVANRLNIDKERIFIADSDDIESLIKLTSKTKVICTTVGPYAKYGSNLIEACIKTNTNYCDITGETQWIRKMIDKYHLKAKENKIKIINSCGFDSIPSDMGVFYSQKKVFEKTGKYTNKINMRVAGAKGGISGGTYNSLSNVLEEARVDKEVRKNLTNPYGLNPIDKQTGPDKADLQSVIFDKVSNSWIAPFVMAGINTKIVRRSHALINFKYGSDFSYDEATLSGKGVFGQVKGYLSLIPIFLATRKKGSFIKNIVDYVLPKSGEGPSKKTRISGYYNLRFYLTQQDKIYLSKVIGDMDPGYGSTSKMLAESAVCLALDKTPKTYGILTPSVGLGDPLLKRLQENAGLTFIFD
ncbi:MAG: saccharopine dehydrogenase [Flavobacteriaceae bacterium]|nr:saccharopine dehydrogenase [Flavobacteriaceae bacterium]|tara:strand:+ start:662 stop:1870 length:1209 start_codon:yes stop_codon:yes gene_type:complete